MLARMGAALGLAGREPTPEILADLKDLLAARRGLLRDLVREKARAKAATHPFVRRQIAARLALVRRQVAALDAELAKGIAADPGLARRAAILASIPGLGPVGTAELLIDMPELGTLSGKQAASLAGVAPVPRQSGRTRGQEHIRGGRSALRRALYMATSGKPAKVIITAVMRNLLVLANTLLAEDRLWQPERP
jgi:transposase